MKKKIAVSTNTPTVIAATSSVFLSSPTVKPIGPLATTIPKRNTPINPGGTLIDPIVAPPRKPSPDPMIEEIRAGIGPMSIPTTNITIGASVMVESGGGMGIAVTVVTAINADMIAVMANFIVALGGVLTI